MTNHSNQCPECDGGIKTAFIRLYTNPDGTRKRMINQRIGWYCLTCQILYPYERFNLITN